ncbi:hypothetical protein B9Z35_11415 [Limnohabitans sp. Jir61]|uniref:sensor histidine kinase n=1 Tax=Limnohabitans sp. Jir61 TaxID=1826168 RepID=UPI000D3710D9|nr:ATP-binding protein [Limnohabitans sp. Jir61]PUE28615.1 hypothetical protein B9Z35_11415 [Limnohabitans sp. Jir61]
MKPPKFLTYVSKRLDDSAKLFVLVAVTVALTSSAIVLSADFVQQRKINELNDLAQRYTAQLRQKIHDQEEQLLNIAGRDDANNFVTFGERAKRLIEENKSYLHIELRDETGVLIAQRESTSAKEVWPFLARQQLPPSVLLSFLRASEQQKIYWAHSYSTTGRSDAEMVVPSRNQKNLWVVRIDVSKWLPPTSGISLPADVQVTYNEHRPESLGPVLTVAVPLELPGNDSHLVFSYATPSTIKFDLTSLTLAILGLTLCVLLIRYALETKKNRLAQETITRQEMALVKQSQLSTMGEVSTALAHELNQPLATIANYVAACEMRMKSQGYEDPVLRDALQNARQQAMRAGEVVQSIRNYLKRKPNVMATVDVKDMLKELEPILMLSAKEHQTQLFIQSEDHLLARIDPALLEQVVLNLSRNGVDAMVDVDPAARKLKINAYTHTSSNGSVWVRIDVEDFGHGVSDEAAASVFESFFTTKAEGMGIGLSLCRSVAESYGGRIRWSNNAAGGATFSLFLPKLLNA